MSAIRSNGALWHSGEHRTPSAPAPRGDAARAAATDVVALHRELAGWRARAADLERRLAAAEARALSSQITPHFLCNSLQAVSSLLQHDPRAADAMVGALSDFLRLALRGAIHSEVPLHRELALLERYVEVMRFRFGDDLRLAVTAEPAAGDALVPQLLIQPLVENAVLHGLRDRGGEIRVSAARDGEMLRCAVADDGRGLRPGPLVEGVGLAGTRRRLRAMYGERHRLELSANANGGATVTVCLPLRFREATIKVVP